MQLWLCYALLVSLVELSAAAVSAFPGKCFDSINRVVFSEANCPNRSSNLPAVEATAAPDGSR